MKALLPKIVPILQISKATRKADTDSCLTAACVEITIKVFWDVFSQGKREFWMSLGAPEVGGGEDGHPLDDLQTVQFFSRTHGR